MFGVSRVLGSVSKGGNSPNRTFNSPIVINPTTSASMKNISPTILPNFIGISIEDPNQLLFEFKLLCKTLK